MLKNYPNILSHPLAVHGDRDRYHQPTQPPHRTDINFLTAEDHRDADTWAIHLWDLVDQRFDPDYTVADFSGGIREGQRIACPGKPCHGDVFHISQRLQKLKRYFANRLKSRLSCLKEIESKIEKVKKKGNVRELSKILSLARKDELKFR